MRRRRPALKPQQPRNAALNDCAPPTKPLRVLIADDHTVVRRGLKQILGEGFPQLVVGEARDSAEALNQATSREWDIVLLDIAMPGRGGMDTLREIKRMRPDTP